MCFPVHLTSSLDKYEHVLDVSNNAYLACCHSSKRNGSYQNGNGENVRLRIALSWDVYIDWVSVILALSLLTVPNYEKWYAC